jgi:hypothetical protein
MSKIPPKAALQPLSAGQAARKMPLPLGKSVPVPHSEGAWIFPIIAPNPQGLPDAFHYMASVQAMCMEKYGALSLPQTYSFGMAHSARISGPLGRRALDAEALQALHEEHALKLLIIAVDTEPYGHALSETNQRQKQFLRMMAKLGLKVGLVFMGTPVGVFGNNPQAIVGTWAVQLAPFGFALTDITLLNTIPNANALRVFLLGHKQQH